MVVSLPVSVRRARREDFAPVAAMLARAFYDDPVTSWFYPNPKRRLARARRFFGIRLRQIADQDLIYTTPDHSGAALWTQPGRWREDLGQSLMLLPMLPVLLPRIAAYLESSKESNVDFYIRHGFSVTDRIDLPDGPPLWFMWREPGPRHRGCRQAAS